MRLNQGEFVILQWVGSVTTRTLRATGKRPFGWNERTFFKMIDLGWVTYNPRTGRAWLTEHGKKIYKKYVAPVSERRKEELKATFESILKDYSPQEEEVQDSLEPLGENGEGMDGKAKGVKEQVNNSISTKEGNEEE